MMESPGALLLRLSEIPGYEWATDTEPFHNSYGKQTYFDALLLPYQYANIPARLTMLRHLTWTLAMLIALAVRRPHFIPILGY